MKYKKMTHTLSRALFAGLLLMGLFTPTLVSAVEPKDPAGGTGGTSQTVDCPDEGDCAKKTAFAFSCGNGKTQTTDVGISCLVITVLNFMSVAVGILVVGGITYGGILFSASGGNPGRKQQAVTIMTNSVIALVLYFLAWSLINFLVPGGVFTS